MYGVQSKLDKQLRVDFTLDELICVCISRQIEDGEVVAQGIATPLVAAGYLLAKCTHAPDLMFASAIGQGICCDWAPLGLSRVEGIFQTEKSVAKLTVIVFQRFFPFEK